MGLHSWFYKNNKLYNEREELYNKLNKHENEEIYLDDIEQLQINSRIGEINILNNAGYHDCFRTSKKEKDGEYTLDKIYSKKDCDKWIDINISTIYFVDCQKSGLEQLNKFWDEYPDGVIDFG